MRKFLKLSFLAILFVMIGSINVYAAGKSLKISPSSIVIEVGEKAKIKVTSKPIATPKFKSSDKAVVTVNRNGVITGKKAGTAKITVTANGLKKKCKVTVTKKATSSKIKLVKKISEIDGDRVYEYYPNGLLKSTSFRSIKEVYEYNSRGDVIRRSTSAYVANYTYDENHLLKKCTYTRNDGSSSTGEYITKNGRITQYNFKTIKGGKVSFWENRTFSYNSNNNLVSMTSYTATWPNGAAYGYSFDSHNNIYKVTRNGSVYSNYTLKYSKDGYLTSTNTKTFSYKKKEYSKSLLNIIKRQQRSIINDLLPYGFYLL